MSSESERRRVQSITKDIARLQQEKAREFEKVAGYQKQSNSAYASAQRASSPSSAQSYLRDGQRYSEQAASAQKNVANIEEKIAREYGRLTDAQSSLVREEEREASNRRQSEERAQREHQQRVRDIGRTLTRHDDLHRETMSAIERLSKLPKKIVVLFMAANPLGQQQLRLDEEARSISEMIRKSAHRDSVKLESCWAVRPVDLLQALNEHRPRILHFSGHGSQQDEIILQDATGAAKPVSKAAITYMLSTASGEVQLVFFNTCFSSNQAEAVVQHVPAAIGMNDSIGDEAARVFAAAFYSAIGFGLSVRRAYEQAKAALMVESIPEECTPELFAGAGVNVENLILVKPPTPGTA